VSSRTFRNAAPLAAVAACVLCAHAVAQVADPTRPPDALPAAEGESETEAPAARRLTAIVISATRRVAVIDGHTVRVGDAVGAARVVSIEPLEVRLHAPEGEVVLSIAGPPVKDEIAP
jgi:MSHA biogenesis protein MshK